MLNDLKKKQYLKNLTTLADKQSNTVDSGDDEPSIDNPPMNIEGDISPAKTEEPATPPAPSITPRQAQNGANVSGDLMVGASHALLALLSGNHNRAAMEYGKGDQYIEGRRKEDLAGLSKLVKTAGPNGKPIYTPTVEAADMEAYVPPAKAGAAGKEFAPQYVKNNKTNELAVAAWKNGQMVQVDDKGVVTKTLDPNEWFKFEQPALIKERLVTGGTRVTPYNKATGKLEPVISNVAGLGDVVRDANTNAPLAKEVAQQNVKTAGNDAKMIGTFKDSKAVLRHAADVVADPNSTGAELAAAVEEGKKAMIGQRLVAFESHKFEGDDYNSFLQNAQNFGSKKISGGIAKFKRDEFSRMFNNGLSEIDAKVGGRTQNAKSVPGLNTGAPVSKPATTNDSSWKKNYR